MDVDPPAAPLLSAAFAQQPEHALTHVDFEVPSPLPSPLRHGTGSPRSEAGAAGAGAGAGGIARASSVSALSSGSPSALSREAGGLLSDSLGLGGLGGLSQSQLARVALGGGGTDSRPSLPGNSDDDDAFLGAAAAAAAAGGLKWSSQQSRYGASQSRDTVNE